MAMMKSRTWQRPLLAVPLCALVLGPMPGCSNPAGPVSGECTRTTVFNGVVPIQGSARVVQSITTPHTGRLRITVDWGLDVNIMSAVLAQGPCSLEQFQANQRNVIVDLFSPPKPLAESTTWL